MCQTEYIFYFILVLYFKQNAMSSTKIILAGVTLNTLPKRSIDQLSWRNDVCDMASAIRWKIVMIVLHSSSGIS